MTVLNMLWLHYFGAFAQILTVEEVNHEMEK